MFEVDDGYEMIEGGEKGVCRKHRDRHLQF
jgi:hypothetical protein